MKFLNEWRPLEELRRKKKKKVLATFFFHFEVKRERELIRHGSIQRNSSRKKIKADTGYCVRLG